MSGARHFLHGRFFSGLLPAVLAITWGWGCNDDDTRPSFDASIRDGQVADALPLVDAEPDSGTPQERCEAILALDRTFDVDPTGPDGQIHASARFDGEAVWVVYNVPDDQGGFDVWAVRLRCDSSPVAPPFQVNTTVQGNDVDPAISIWDDTVHLVWSSDNGTGVNNMDMFYRSFLSDGTPILGSDRLLETTRDGTPVSGNVMAPSVAAMPCNYVAVAAVRGLEETQTFQVFVQLMQASGDYVQEALDPYVELGVTHSAPAVAGTFDCSVHLAWARAVGTGDDVVVQTRYGSDWSTASPLPPVEAIEGLASTSPSLVVSPDDQHVYLALAGADGAIWLKDGATYDPLAAAFELGSGLGLLHSPIAAASTEGRGAVVFYRNLSGVQNELYGQAFTFDGSTFTLADPVVITPGPAYFYPPAFTHVAGTTYFATWSEGTSPNLRLKARFVDLAP